MTQAAAITVENAGEFDDTSDLTPELKLEQYFKTIGTGSEVSIGIYQIDPANRRRKGFLFYCDPEQLAANELFSQCLAEHGPGEYEAIAQLDGEISFAQRFVLGPIKKERFKVPPSAGSVASANAPAGTDPALLAILQTQQKMLEKLLENQSQSSSRDAIDVIKEAAAMRELFAPAPAPAALGGGIGEVLSLVRDVIAFKDELGGDDADPLSLAAKTLVPAITKAVEAMQQQGDARRTLATQDLSPGTPARAPTVNAQGVGRLIGTYLPTIISSARGGVLPSDVAQQILKNIDPLSDQVKVELVDYLDDEDVVDKIARMDEGVLELREWFEQLVDVLIASLSQDIGEREKPIEGEVLPGGVGREVGEWSPGVVGSEPNAGETELDADDASGGDDTHSPPDPGR